MSHRYAVECLRCGKVRIVARKRNERLAPGACPHCGHLDWALVADLSETALRVVRDKPVGRRRLRVAP